MAASPSRLPLWEDVTAANGPPTVAGDGFVRPGSWDDVVVSIYTTAGSTPTVLAKLWVYLSGDDALWVPLGVDPTGIGDATLAGLLNEGFPIGTVSGSDIRHVEAMTGISNFKRVYLELVTLTGTATLTAAMRRRHEQ